MHSGATGSPRVTGDGDRAQKEPQAVLVLKGLSDLPAEAMLAVADRLRQAMRTIGIADVRIVVKTSDEPSTP